MPAVTRIGDKHVQHCTTPINNTGSSDVFANGIGVSRETDSTTVHGGDLCIPHVSTIASGSSTVYVNGLSIARIGDPSCTSVAQGSPDVFAGG